MKHKFALTVASLVLVSLLAFSNRCERSCDGKKSYMPAESEVVASSTNDEAVEQADQANSPLLRMVITL